MSTQAFAKALAEFQAHLTTLIQLMIRSQSPTESLLDHASEALVRVCDVAMTGRLNTRGFLVKIEELIRHECRLTSLDSDRQDELCNLLLDAATMRLAKIQAAVAKRAAVKQAAAKRAEAKRAAAKRAAERAAAPLPSLENWLSRYGAKH